MKFMCVVILDQEIADGMGEADWKEIDRQSMEYDQDLMKRKKYIMSEALQGPDTARTVRVRKGQPMMTDGPFVETKEQLAGFIIIEAEDMEEAMAIATEIPIAKIGAVEVRPVLELPWN